MRWLILTIYVLIGVALQATLRIMLNIPWLIPPDIILLLTISYGLLRGPQEGLIFGVIAGFFLDLNSGGIVGLGALTKMLAGFLAGLLEKTIFKDNLLVPALAGFAGTLVFTTLEMILHLAFNANIHFGFTFLSVVLPLAVYNTVLAPGVYYILFKTEHFLIQRDSSM